uniref:substrate-binding domain-containing protein n=1 Tax=Brevibacillus agri TaxID=51101 RepID=UPI00286825B9
MAELTGLEPATSGVTDRRELQLHHSSIGPAIKKAQAAGIVVVAVDTAAEGADATVTTNNVQAGEISCQYIVDKLGGKGDVIIENGPQVSAVIDRVTGCKNVFGKNAGIK